MRIAEERSLIRAANGTITLANRWDHLLARVGYRRGHHRVAPDLYALGSPSADSHVFVTANYTLSFDALRSALAGIDGYILVLDTQGINVWCAAGKGTFSTDELVRSIEETGLREVVAHRVVILPQLAAPGVAAHQVERRSGFAVEYGPVRAANLPEYLKTGKATPEMRKVRFGLAGRITLIPVELTAVLVPTLIAAALLYLFLGTLSAVAAVAAVLAGVALFPILLPWIPTSDFSSKGFVLGLLVAIPFAAAALGRPGAASWSRFAEAMVYMLAMPAVTAFLSLNFTGSTTFTSWSWVRREMFAHIPRMAWSFGAGILLLVSLLLAQRLGGS